MVTTQSAHLIGADETSVGVTAGGHIAAAQTFDKILVCVRTPIHDGSGGQQLENAPIGGVQLRNGSGNHLMFIGGVGNSAPFSGRGFSLYGGETVFLPVTNLNAVSLMSTVSGEHIECMAFLDGHETALGVSGMYIAPNVSGPGILSVSPTSGISGAATNSEIFVIFDKCVDPLTVDVNSFVVRVSGDSTNISGIVSSDITNCAKFYMTPMSGLVQTSTMYRATLANSITDLVGNPLAAGSGVWHWTTINTTAPVDTTRPNISGTVPTSGLTDVSVNVIPQILFSEQMQSGTIHAENVRLRISGINIPGTTVLESDLRTATITPDDALEPNKAYRIDLIESNVKDIAGNAISGDELGRKFFTEDGNWNLVYNVAHAGLENQLDDDKFRIGMTFLTSGTPYVGQQIVKVRLNLKRGNDSLAGDQSGVVVQIRKVSDNSVIQFGMPFKPFLDQSGDLLNGTFRSIDFYNSDNTYPIAANDKLEIEWISGGGDAGRINVGKVDVNAIDSVRFFERTGTTYSGSTDQNFSTRDIAGMFWTR